MGKPAKNALYFVLCLCSLLFLQTVTAATPDTSAPRTRFQPVVAGALLVGQSGRDFAAEVAATVAYKNWHVGPGAALDFYQFRTVPLFLSIRKHFQKPMPLFAYANIGTNMPLIKKGEANNWINTTHASGLYYDVGGGWQANRAGLRGLFVSLGYSVKNLKEEIKSGQREPGVYTAVTKSNYNFRRVAIKIGYQF